MGRNPRGSQDPQAAEVERHIVGTEDVLGAVKQTFTSKLPRSGKFVLFVNINSKIMGGCMVFSVTRQLNLERYSSLSRSTFRVFQVHFHEN